MSTTKTGMSAGRPSSRTGTTAKTVQDLITNQEDEMERVNFNLARHKKRALKAYAVSHDKTLTEIFEEYVDTLIQGR